MVPGKWKSKWLPITLGLIFILCLRFAVFFCYDDLFPAQYSGSLILGVITAKESTYLDEWLAHHLYHGVDKIQIFDNNPPESAAEKAEMRRICATYGERCGIADFNQYDGVGCLFASPYLCSSMFLTTYTDGYVLEASRRQSMAWNELYHMEDNYRRYRWLLMIDVDEFLVTTSPHKIPTLLDMIPANVGGVRVGRMTFGTSNHTTRPKTDVRSSYCHRQQLIANSKGMARSSEITWPGISNHKYVTKSFWSQSGFKHMNRKWVGVYHGELLGGKVVDTDCYQNMGMMMDDNLFINPSLLVINHYFTKSVEEWFERRECPSVNYALKLTEVFTDNKLEGSYPVYECPSQRLDKLPPLSSAKTLAAALVGEPGNVSTRNVSITLGKYLRVAPNICGSKSYHPKIESLHPASAGELATLLGKRIKHRTANLAKPVTLAGKSINNTLPV